MSKKRVSSVESMEDMILWIFTRLEKIQKSKWREVYLLSPFILLDFFQIGKNLGIWVKSKYHQLNHWQKWYYGFLRDWKKSRNQNGDRYTCSHLSFCWFFFQFGKNPGIWEKSEYHQLNQWKTWVYGFLQDWKKIQKSKWREVYLLSPFIFHVFFLIWYEKIQEYE